MDRARTYAIGLGAAAVAVGIGLIVLAWLGAPRSYLILNATGLAAGALLGAGLLAWPQLPGRGLGAAALAGGAAVLLTAFFGVPLEGVRRWVRAGPLLLHVGVIALPFLLAAAARRSGPLSMLAAGLALLGAALQADAAIATAMAAGLLTVAALRPSPTAWLLSGLSVAAAAWAWTRPDPLPAVTLVEGILPLAFHHSAPAGLVASLGLALPVAALVALGLGDPTRRVMALTLAAGFAGVVVAALTGNYPTPLLGFGLSPILCYVLGWSLLAGSGRDPGRAQSSG